ncbi:MAG TPA: universal stress protein, partial [Anaerolineae bacterium]|nr:universal stress protein [Anaerolineae bacterium]
IARAASKPATILGVLENPSERKLLDRALAQGQEWLAGAPPPELKVRKGHAAEEILKEAEAGAYDLVVLGARGRRGITRFLMGSTAERIARHSSLPVLIVRGWLTKIEKILICTAAGEPGLAAVETGGRLAALVGAEVTVLHVMSQVPATYLSTRDLEDLEGRADDLMAHRSREGVHLKKALALLGDMGVSARARVRHGLVVDEIMHEACGQPYDMVVIGTHIAPGWMRFLLEDVTRQLISCIDRAILVAKTPAGESH